MNEFETVCSVLSILPDAVVVVDDEQRIRFCNEAAESLFRYDPGTLTGKRLDVLIPPRYRRAHGCHVAAMAEVPARRQMGQRPLLAGLSQAGEEIPVSAALSTFVVEGQRFRAAIVRDQRAVASRFMQIISAAETDPLTGIGNRRYLMGRLAPLAQSGACFSLLYLDLDGFKPLNDRHGHPFGDAVLRVVAGRLQGSLRRRDCCARLGGDEFVALVEGICDTDALALIARKVLSRLGEPMNLQGQTARVGTSIGALACQGPRPDQELLARADALMYQAKQRGDAEHLVVADDRIDKTAALPAHGGSATR